MARRIISAGDLDRLLDLVEQNRANDAYGDAYGDDGRAVALQPAGPVWKSNYDFWVEQLKEETSSSWSEQQYNDAANLINFAEYQRVTLRDFTDVVAGNDDTAISDEEIGWGHASHDIPDTFATVADQIQLRQDFDSAPTNYSANDSAIDDSSRSGEPLNHQKADAAEHTNSNRADLAALSAIRSRETGTSQFNQIRSDLYVQTGLSGLRPYTSWDDFQVRNNLSDELLSDLKVAYPDGFDAVDAWVAGLAEISGSGNEVSTLHAAITDEVDRLHQASDDLGLVDLLSTGFSNQLNSLTYDAIVERHAQSGRLHDALFEDASSTNDFHSAPVNMRAANLVIEGSNDDDILIGGAGGDTIYGGTGDDVIIGGAGDDKLHGGQGADRLYGGVGNDELHGDTGNDVLDGETGADTMYGGIGDDTIYVGNQDDRAIEASGEGTDTVKAAVHVYVLPDNVEILVYIGHSDFIGTGNELANFIAGGDGTDTLSGEAGDDTLVGGDGDDVLDGGDGSNLLDGGLGSDVIIIRNVNDIVIERAGEGTDTVQTTLSSYALSDNVEILVHVGDSDFTGLGNALDNFLAGSAGNDQLDGGAGDDYLDGGIGDDTLDGGEGDDIVIGGQGNDYVMFTRGSDTLVLRQGFGNDVVFGFDTSSLGPGGSDRIDVSSYGYTADSLGVDILLLYDGESTTVRIGADSVKLVLVDIHTMDRHDFIFS